MLNFNRIAQLHRELADAYAEDDGQTYSADDERDWPNDADAPQDDPWADNSNNSYQREPRQSQPRQSGNGGQRQGNSRQGTETDKLGRKWTFGKHGAPMCDGNDNHAPMPAAYVVGEKKDGSGVYKVWACSLGSGERWRDKCDTWKFTR